MTREDLQRHYKSLEVTPDTPWDDIKRSYRDLMKVWHPDRFAGDKRLQKIVEEKTKELTYAFKKVEEDYHSITFSTEPQFEDEPRLCDKFMRAIFMPPPAVPKNLPNGC
jgi:curved DNA-binding protein CbpA